MGCTTLLLCLTIREELVAEAGREKWGAAVTTIISENPNEYVETIPRSVTAITSNYISSCVLVFVDDSCIVTRVPNIG
ncbi:hypothetical protein CRG98_031625 [Punica granatum]|uniref:Uncharacterized protein n=1 Tax=Punica granatum TaxID=22663 RepID=A0A2I0IVD3_PUNGR|nr:hypothetical protein CRG98_031625 [Punica granatum]